MGTYEAYGENFELSGEMLRYVFRVHRRQEEACVEYMQRLAAMIDDIAAQHSMRDWVVEHRRTKWRVSGEIARKVDRRWSTHIIFWKPFCGIGRTRGRPKLRWSDDLEHFAGGDWQDVARDRAVWKNLEEGFATRC